MNTTAQTSLVATPPQSPSTTEPVTQTQAKLLQLLTSEPQLADALVDTLKTERWFVTISRPHNNFRAARGYSANDKMVSLNEMTAAIRNARHYLGDRKSKKPAAEASTDQVTLTKGELLQLLAPEPELTDALINALKTGSWFVTISRPHDNFRDSKDYCADDKIHALADIMNDVTHDPDYLGDGGYDGGQYLL